nr:endolytic transglycosylase MltG [Vibrio sinus]
MILFIAVAAGSFWFVNGQVNQYLNQPLLIDSSQLVTVDSGTNLKEVLKDLTQRNWISSSPYARIVDRFRPDLTDIKAGTYDFKPDETLGKILALLVSGKEHQFSITFIEGSRFSEWMKQLEDTPYIEHTLKGMSEADIAAKLGIKEKDLEGLFLPQTYNYTAGTTDLEILRRAHKALFKHLDELWKDRQKDLPIKTPYDALILASLIEKETAIESERITIASVFVNRLNKHMRLQTDPTVIYGMGSAYHGNITKKDLRTPTPYNTYIIRGLPPTPIAMAGLASIKAALHPGESPYYYFVASGTGGHVFSKTLTQHNIAVRAYLRKLRSNK